MSPQHPAPCLRSAIRPAPWGLLLPWQPPGLRSPLPGGGMGLSLRGLVPSGVTWRSGGQGAVWGPGVAARRRSVRLRVQP